MTDPGQFEFNKPPAGNDSSSSLDCAAVELLLAESAEKTLPSAVVEQLRIHALECVTCREKLAQTRRGREWLLVLKQESLEPPDDLVAKILARTSLANTTEIPEANNTAPAQNRRILDFAIRDRVRYQHDRDAIIPSHGAANRQIHSSAVVLRRTLLEPRLALVAAMAFFSISLTMNLMGVRLTSLHASDLTPRGLHRVITRQYADTNARVVRYYANLRIVYEVEARVQQLRRAAETSTPTQQEVRPRKQSSNSSRDSSGRRTNSYRAGSRKQQVASNPGLQGKQHTVVPDVLPAPEPMVTGPRMEAAFHSSCPFPGIYFSRRYFSIRERKLA